MSSRCCRSSTLANRPISKTNPALVALHLNLAILAHRRGSLAILGLRLIRSGEQGTSCREAKTGGV